MSGMETEKIKVAFYVYPTAFQAPGGGEIQLLKTKEYLEKAGQEVRLFDPWHDSLRDFDILHVFGSVKECLNMILTAKQRGTKVVLSTICWYSWTSAWGTYTSARERAASGLRHLAKSFFPFLPSMRRGMMQHSDLLFPNSQSEAVQLARFFGVPKEKIWIVPNGVSASFANARPEIFIEKFGLKDFILCVGRIEPRKNQLNMIRALEGTKIPLVFIGEAVPRYKSYYEACRREAGRNVSFLGAVSHDSGLLASAYAACNTFLLASWLETPGLAALEAALAGAKVVITDQGATREYFKDYVAYVSPKNFSEIRRKTLAAFQGPKHPGLKEHVRKNYLWENVAQITLEGYQRCLNRDSTTSVAEEKSYFLRPV